MSKPAKRTRAKSEKKSTRKVNGAHATPSKKQAKRPAADGVPEKEAQVPATARARPSRERDPRLPAPGTILEREYDGKTIRVTVLEKGFELDGKRYRSLSGIAREITKCSVNGFAWFRLTRAASPRATEGA